MARVYTYHTNTDPSVVDSIEDVKGDVRAIPQSTNTTIVSSDSGKHLNISSNVTLNSSTGFSAGDAVTIYNNSSSTINITASGVTLRQAGSSNTGNRTLAQYGLATILCVGTNTYVISGTGVG